jgi:hypothetical protein
VLCFSYFTDNSNTNEEHSSCQRPFAV